MDTTDVLKHKPTRDELTLPKAELSKLTSLASKHAMTAQLAILSAQSAEELAIAIALFHGALTQASAVWTKIADETRHWAH